MAIKRIGKTVTVENSLSEYFDAFRLALKRPITKQVGHLIMKFVQSAVQRNFVIQKDHKGHKWPALSEFTIAEREREGYGAEPKLVRTGALFHAATDNIKMKIARGGKSIEMYAVPPNKKTRNKMRMHNRPVSSIFMLQSPTSDVPIPGREFFYLARKDMREITGVVVFSILGQATRIARSKGVVIKHAARANSRAARAAMSGTHAAKSTLIGRVGKLS